jgi:hypothetical protein
MDDTLRIIIEILGASIIVGLGTIIAAYINKRKDKPDKDLSAAALAKIKTEIELSVSGEMRLIVDELKEERARDKEEIIKYREENLKTKEDLVRTNARVNTLEIDKFNLERKIALLEDANKIQNNTIIALQQENIQLRTELDQLKNGTPC